MDLTKQSQQAGDYSSLQQASVINNVTVIQFDEGKCREVCKKFFEEVQQSLVCAMELAQKREMAFEDSVVKRLQKIDNSMSAFSDPAFLKSLNKSQQAAICTDRESDYDLLSELLVKRFEVGSDKQHSLYVNKAIELVDEMPEEALLCITIFHVFSQILFTYDSLELLRNHMSFHFRSILCNASLPSSCRWIEDLEMMSVARIMKLSTLKKAKDIMLRNCSSIIQTGIKIDSENYYKALEILDSCGFNADAFHENPLVKNHVYIRLEKKSFGYLLFIKSSNNAISPVAVSGDKAECLHSIYNLYDETNEIKGIAREGFITYMREDSTIRNIMNWWDSIPFAFEINPVAAMLANVNARRLDQGLPILDI